MTYHIYMAPGHVTTMGDNRAKLTYQFALAHEAANQLQRIAECVEQAGGTVTGAGFARWATINDGRDKVTYQIIET